jgi:DNA polymerase-3 subunit delta
MPSSYTEILSDLKKRKFAPVYLLHGEEPYYIDLVSDHIESTVLNDMEKGFNQTVLYGRDTDITTVLNASKRYPMMSDYQVVIVKEAQDLKFGKEDDKKGMDPFLLYLEQPLQSTLLVLCYKYARFDKRKKIYKAIEKKGVILESSPVYDSKMPAWITGFVREKKASIHPRAAELLAEYLGNDLSKAVNELEKLLLNTGEGKEINEEDVQRNTGISKDYNVFELQSALAKKDILKANRIVDYFAANPKNNPVTLILSNLNSYFTKLLRYHSVSDRSPQNLAKELGINPYFVREYEQAARNFPVSTLFGVISSLREYDLKSKGVDSVNTSPGDLLKELLFKLLHSC